MRGSLLAPIFALLACRSAAPRDEPAPVPGAVSAASASSEIASAPSSALPPAPQAPEPSVAVNPSASASASAERPLVFVPVPVKLPRDGFPIAVGFDGGQRFSMWLETMRVARDVERATGKRPHFTFFLSAAYLTRKAPGSTIGAARSDGEILVRRGLVQQALLDGHEIADHGVGHEDGRAWDVARWTAELRAFAAIVGGGVFEPVRRDGAPAFPRWMPPAGARAGQLGARCKADSDCEGNLCVEVAAADRFCSNDCNSKRPCPTGTACGAPAFVTDVDVCLPLPMHPVRIDGTTAFDANGKPEAHAALVPHRAKGFRAPFLGTNAALIEALGAAGYAYDASFTVLPGPPSRVGRDAAGAKLLELGLVRTPGVRTIPMDYNYYALHEPPSRMREDYRRGIVAAYEAGTPFTIGHHFAAFRLRGGTETYFEVLREAIEWIHRGCPDDGKKKCEGAIVVSYRELAEAIAAAAG